MEEIAKETDFIFNGNKVVNDGVVIKLKLTKNQRIELIKKKKGRKWIV